MSEAREVELSSPALMVLNDLKDNPQPADHYRPEMLNELKTAGFIRDLPNNRIGITSSGLEYLLPPGKPRPFIKPLIRNGAPPPASKPAAAAVPSTRKLVDAPSVLAALTKAGGSMALETLNADGRTLRGLREAGKIIRDGDTIKLAKPEDRAIVPSLPTSAPLISEDAPVEKSLKPTLTIETHACADDCSTCATGRALAFLTNTSPAIKAMVERFQAHEADQQRLKSFGS